MKKSILSFFIIIALVLSLFTSCTDNPEPTKPTEPTVNFTDFANSTEILNTYFSSFTKGDSAFYGTWKIQNFDYLTFVFRNDNCAEMIMGTEGNFTALKIDEKKKTLTAKFLFGLNGTYNYEFSNDNKTLTLTMDGTQTIMTKTSSTYSFVPKGPDIINIDEKITGWWKSKAGLIYYFGADGIMYSNIISSETCYTYKAGNGKIEAVYDLGGGVTDKLTYKYKNDTLTIENNKYTRFDPFTK